MRTLLWGSLLLCGVAACSDGSDLDSDEEARRGYLGLDESIAKSITLGFAGFNSAQSANISPQSMAGTEAGMLTVTGQVDQGSSNNKGMRLSVGMVDYTDGEFVVNDDGDTFVIVYNTDDDIELQPKLSMQLKNIPSGTLEGTLIGAYRMTGDLDADVELNLSFSGQLMDLGNGEVGRAVSTTTVTGTAVSGDGTFEIELSI